MAHVVGRRPVHPLEFSFALRLVVAQDQVVVEDAHPHVPTGVDCRVENTELKSILAFNRGKHGITNWGKI